MKTKRFLLIVVSTLCMMVVGCSRNSGEDIPNGGQDEPNIETTPSDSSIIGTWELKTVCYPEGNHDISLDDRDLFMFDLNGKVNVVIKKGKPLYPDLPNVDGEYDYSYDKEKQIIQLCEETLNCIIAGDEMHIEGYHDGPDDGIYNHEYIFIKKQI